MVSFLAYIAIVTVAALSYASVSLAPAGLVLGAGSLFALQLFEQRRYRPHLASMGMSGLIHSVTLASVGNSLLAALTACLLGVGSRLMFGL